MAKGVSTWKVTLACLVITLVILAIFIAVFIAYIVPTNGITSSEIYSVMSRLFPVFIGALLIEIGILISRRSGDSPADSIDKLSPNAYDAPLFTSPLDDPGGRAIVESITSKLERENIEKEAKKSTKETIRSVTVEVEKPIIKEVPVEVIREVPIEIVKEIYREGEKIVEVPVEVIKEVIIEQNGGATSEETKSLASIVEDEIELAHINGYPFTLASVPKEDAEEAKKRVTDAETILEGERLFILLPFFERDEAKSAMSNIKGLKIAEMKSDSDAESLIKKVL